MLTRAPAQVELHNLYGPTEAAVDVTHWRCVDDGSDSVPIGWPIDNITVHVLDAYRRPVPVGVTGELYLGGAGLADGYHGQPELTAERFVSWVDHNGIKRRLYRTGDLVRHRPDGALVFLGRTDDQVKIRGFRVELGEVQAALACHPGIHEVAVVDREEGATRSLAAYLVLEPGEAPAEGGGAVGRLEGHQPFLAARQPVPRLHPHPLDRKAAPRHPERHRRAEHAGGPARRLAVGGAVVGLAAVEVRRQRLGERGEPYALGDAGRYTQASKWLTGTGAVLTALGRRSRTARVIGAGLLLGGALCERWAVYRAGFISARDPKYTVGPQRARIAGS